VRIPRLYLPLDLAAGLVVPLPREKVHYLKRVLRLRAGTPLSVFNGRGGQFQAELSTDGGQILVREHQDEERESPLAITLIQGVSRGERMEFTLRKATELGVSRVLPITTSRCEVKLNGKRLEKRLAHWHGILVSACEQCGRNRLPDLPAPQTLDQALIGFQTGPGDTLGLILDPLAAHSLPDFPVPGGSVVLLVGPEGGLSPGEIASATQVGFAGVRLGPRILRTETAPLAALAAIQVLWGDLA
jgi:16S rRNA (uracil1498-N3)-methyltransferase